MISQGGPTPPGTDLLGPPEPAPRGPAGRAGNLLVGGVGAAAITIAATGVAFAAYLSGGGPQPEQVLPAAAVAMVKVDLDPAAGQKAAAHRLAERFPSLAEHLGDADNLKDDLLSALLSHSDLDYDRDVAPWIGDRVALAAVPGEDEPEPLAAVAFTDRAAAQTALQDVAQDDEDVFYAFSEHADYVLLGTAQETVDAAAGTSDVLADSPSWQAGTDALDGDQIVTAWADLRGLWEALPQQARDEAARFSGVEDDVEISGTVIVGAHVGDAHLEVVGHAVELTGPQQLLTPVGGRPGSGLVQRLPSDTVAALAVTELGDGLADSLEGAADDDLLGVLDLGEELGLDLPEDLRALLGEETVVAVLGEQEGGVRTRTDDVDAAMRSAQTLLQAAGGGDRPVLQRLDDGIVMATSQESLAALVDADGELGDSDAFRAAVPDADDAGMLLYLDVARAVELFAPDLGDAQADVAQLQALGLTSSGDQRNSSFRLRLTLKQ